MNTTVVDEHPARTGLPIGVYIGLSAAPIVAYGLSRFAYALVLPAMHEDLSLDFAQSGGLGTANNLGYLLGAVMAVRLVNARTARVVFIWGILLSALFVTATGLFRDYSALSAMRFLSGVPSAMSLVAGGLLASHAGQGDRRQTALALNLYYAGGGTGIILSSLAAFFLFGEGDTAANWPLSWYALGALSFLVVFPAIWAARHVTIPQTDAKGAGPGSQSTALPIGALVMLGSVYFCFGVGYSGYMTFVVAYVRETVSDVGVITFWLMIGVAAICGAFLWSWLFHKFQERQALAAVMLTIASGQWCIGVRSAFCGLDPVCFAVWLDLPLCGRSGELRRARSGGRGKLEPCDCLDDGHDRDRPEYRPDICGMALGPEQSERRAYALTDRIGAGRCLGLCLAEGSGTVTEGLDLSAKTAIVTGATGTLGKAIVQELVAAGGRVLLVDRDGAALERISAELGSPEQVRGFSTDMSAPDYAKTIIEAAAEAFGGLDVVVTAAGLLRRSAFEEADPKDVALMARVNFDYAARPDPGCVAGVARWGCDCSSCFTIGPCRPRRKRSLRGAKGRAGCLDQIDRSRVCAENSCQLRLARFFQVTPR